MGVIDKHIGSKIRILRRVRRMTQKELANEMSISFQQLQKNEKGDSKISCSRLCKLAMLLKVDMHYFLDDVLSPQGTQAAGLLKKDRGKDPILSREEIKLLTDYEKIKDRNARRSVKYIVSSLARRELSNHK